MHPGHQQYQRAHVTLASPAMLVVMLYNELLCCLTRAKEAAIKNDMTTQRKNTTKAVRILTGLMASLNMDQGEEIALNLALLYEYIAKRLLQAGRDHHPEPFDDAIRLLTPLKEAWEKIAASPSPVDLPTPWRLAQVTA